MLEEINDDRSFNDEYFFLKEICEGLYFFGDGHSSHGLVENKGGDHVTLNNLVVSMIIRLSEERCFPSFLISYVKGYPDEGYKEKEKLGLMLKNFDSNTSFKEDCRYFIKN